MATGSVLASTAGYAYAGAEAQGGAAGSPGVASGNSVQVPVEVPINACGNTVDVIGVLNPAFGNRCANASTSRHAAPPPVHVSQPGGAGTGGAGAGGSHSGGSHIDGPSTDAHRGPTASGASASGGAVGSPGVISGNSVQAPVHVPVNACGNSVNVVGAANPAFGNSCGNGAQPAPKPTDDCPEDHTPATPPAGSGESGQGGGRNGGSSTGSTPVTAPATGGVTQAAARTSTPVTPVAQAAASNQLASTGAGGAEVYGAAGLALLIGGGVLYRRARAGAR
ncbi:chaplin family protein [Kitasatospora sp. NPDC048194]|uniref:chaplin n=1 Tax=Kitasatospora sp. NPDC048194 TaxID=3364045 RepID=UPI0037165685